MARNEALAHLYVAARTRDVKAARSLASRVGNRKTVVRQAGRLLMLAESPLRQPQPRRRVHELTRGAKVLMREITRITLYGRAVLVAGCLFLKHPTKRRAIEVVAPAPTPRRMMVIG